MEILTGLPKFLQTYEEEIVGRRPKLQVDDLEEGGTALDTVRFRPGYKTRTIKKAKRKLQEAEEFRAFVEQKQAKAITVDQLKAILENDGIKGNS